MCTHSTHGNIFPFLRVESFSINTTSLKINGDLRDVFKVLITCLFFL